SLSHDPPPDTPDTPTLSLHDALPICHLARHRATSHTYSPAARHPVRPAAERERHHRSAFLGAGLRAAETIRCRRPGDRGQAQRRSEEHTSELQSPCNLVCRLLLEKKK